MNHLVVNEKPLIISIIITAFISAFLLVTQPDENGVIHAVNTPDMLLNTFYSIISSAYVLISIRIIRGKIKSSSKPPYIETELSIWDYIWRYFAVAWVASFSLVVLVFLPMDTIVGKVIYTVLILVLIPLITLILFGKNRIDKIKNLTMYFTGIPRS